MAKDNCSTFRNHNMAYTAERERKRKINKDEKKLNDDGALVLVIAEGLFVKQ